MSDDSRAAGFLRFFHARPDDVVPTKLKLKWLGVAGQKSKYRHEKKCSFAKAGEGDVVPANDPLDPFEQSTSVAMLFWKMHDRMSNSMHNVCLRYEQRIEKKNTMMKKNTIMYSDNVKILAVYIIVLYILRKR